MIGRVKGKKCKIRSHLGFATKKLAPGLFHFPSLGGGVKVREELS